VTNDSALKVHTIVYFCTEQSVGISLVLVLCNFLESTNIYLGSMATAVLPLIKY